MNIGERIKQRRKELNISADTVAEKLGVSRSTIFRYEKGDIEKLPTNILDDISSILNTTPAYLMGWSENKDISFIYNKLEESRQLKVYSFAKQQLEEQNNKIVNLQNFKEEKQRFEFPWKGYVSAGTGEYMDGETNETICLYEDEIPDEADFALTINGDSMKPMFKDHETIFVKKTNELQSGSIGIVIINDESYIKKIYYGQFSMTLVSLNSEYDDVYVDRNDNVKFIGKVIL